MPEQDLTPYLNDTGTHVHVVHSETGAHWDSPVDYLPAARRLGWEPADSDVDPLEGLVDVIPGTAEVIEQTGFDPAEHTVDEVNDHLAAHADQSPGEVARVLELEAAGKARVGITEGPHAADPDANPDDDADDGDA